MDCLPNDDDWEIFLSSKHPTPQPPSDIYIDVEEIEEYDDEEDDNDDRKSELACPFCSEDFDLLELYCHIDSKHHFELKSKICPVCITEVRTNIAAHIVTRHENILKIFCKNKRCNGESRSALSLLRKELQDTYLNTLSRDPSCVVSSSDMAPDPLLFSFIYNPPPLDMPEIVEASSSTQASLLEKSSDQNMLERNMEKSFFPDKTLVEKARKYEFVHGLLFSTILDDDL